MTKEEKQKAIDALKISAPVRVMTQEEFNNYIRTINQVMNWLEQEPTTKNDLGVTSGLEKNSKKLEKDFGELDCISRADARKAIIDHQYSDSFCEEHNIDHSINTGMALIALSDLPSVTPQEPRWIPTSKRLPNSDDVVLCWYEYYHWSQEKVLPEYGLGRYFKVTKAWFGEVAYGKDVRVIAWMPLPEHYEPQESEG